MRLPDGPFLIQKNRARCLEADDAVLPATDTLLRGEFLETCLVRVACSSHAGGACPYSGHFVQARGGVDSLVLPESTIWRHTMKYFLRRLLVPVARYKSYNDPQAVGGWAGWYEIAGGCIAFQNVDGGLCTRW